MAAPMSTPKHDIVFRKIDADKSLEHISEVIASHPFNHGIDIVVPQTFLHHSVYFPDEEKHSFLVEDLPLEDLISEEFIGAFVKRGKLYMLSHQTYVDQNDCAALWPKGPLMLVLNQSTYHELGLTGETSKFSSCKKNKYAVKIDVTAKNFKSGHKTYDRVKSCFQKNPNLKMNFLVTWVPHDEEICASSIGEYFRKRGHVTHSCGPQFSESSDAGFVPDIDPDQLTQSSESCGAIALHEWLGAMSCGVTCDDKCRPYVSTFTCAEPNFSASACYVCRIRGFMSQELISETFRQLREILSQRDVPWFSFSIHGFHDSPVSWSNKEHGFYLHGDNISTFVVFKDGTCWSYKAFASPP